jgi:hypothetical protein
VSVQGCGSATSSLERFAAVHAGHLPGCFVVRRLSEVEPSFTSGLAFSGIAVFRSGRDSGSRSGGSRAAGRYRGRRRVLGSDVADSVGNGGEVLHHGQVRELRCNRWQGETQGRSGEIISGR